MFLDPKILKGILDSGVVGSTFEEQPTIFQVGIFGVSNVPVDLKNDRLINPFRKAEDKV